MFSFVRESEVGYVCWYCSNDTLDYVSDRPVWTCEKCDLTLGGNSKIHRTSSRQSSAAYGRDRFNPTSKHIAITQKRINEADGNIGNISDSSEFNRPMEKIIPWWKERKLKRQLLTQSVIFPTALDFIKTIHAGKGGKQGKKILFNEVYRIIPNPGWVTKQLIYPTSK